MHNGVTLGKITPAEAAQNRGPETIAVICILAVIAAVFISLRLWARRVSKTPLWIDDYLVLLAFAICLTLLGLAFRAVSTGTGQHIEVLHPHAYVETLKILWSTQFLYTWCLAAVKLSILMQLWRVFNVMDRFRTFAYVVGTLIVLWTIATTITGLMECRPLHMFWDNPAGYNCISAEKYLFANAIPNIFTTSALMLVPIPFVVRLPIHSWQRAGVIVTFALGCFTILVSIYRITVVYAHKSSPDVTWSFTDIIIWSAVEYSVAIVCANIPALAPLVRSLLRRFYHSKGVSSVRKTVVHRFSTPTRRSFPRVSWLQQPTPVAESTLYLNRSFSGDAIVMLEENGIGGSEYVRGPGDGRARLNRSPTEWMHAKAGWDVEASAGLEWLRAPEPAVAVRVQESPICTPLLR